MLKKFFPVRKYHLEDHSRLYAAFVAAYDTALSVDKLIEYEQRLRDILMSKLGNDTCDAFLKILRALSV